MVTEERTVRSQRDCPLSRAAGPRAPTWRAPRAGPEAGQARLPFAGHEPRAWLHRSARAAAAEDRAERLARREFIRSVLGAASPARRVGKCTFAMDVNEEFHGLVIGTRKLRGGARVPGLRSSG